MTVRNEDEIRAMADKTSSILSGGRIDYMDRSTLIASDGTPYEVERLRGIKDALDWALGDDEDPPL